VTRANGTFHVIMEKEDGTMQRSLPFTAAYFEYNENGCLIALNADGEVTGYFSPGWQYAVEYQGEVE
jgi:hypothetical protein